MYRVLDLYAGMGGFSLGFQSSETQVVGVDRVDWTPELYNCNSLGLGRTIDLSTSSAFIEADILLGGPPCKPWSQVNVTKRGARHPDRKHLERYFEHVSGLQPRAFVMENVPPVGNDSLYMAWVKRLSDDYAIQAKVIKYSDFGAATSRHRLFTVGIRDRPGGHSFFEKLSRHRRRPSNVRDAIGWLSTKGRGEVADHIWSNPQTIEKYREYYETGKYGWYKLDYNAPAPSFGNVTKTYTLHPEYGNGGGNNRVVSIREVMSIMGYPPDFTFPSGLSMTNRYQMVADTISPVASRAVAKTLLAELREGAR